MYFVAGVLHYHATKTGRTAGSNPCLWGKWIPGKMHTPTCSPKTRKATCTKSSVSRTQSLSHPSIKRNRSVFNPLVCVSTVHNVKPECLDSYNKLWWVLSRVTDCSLLQRVQKRVTAAVWGCVVYSCLVIDDWALLNSFLRCLEATCLY